MRRAGEVVPHWTKLQTDKHQELCMNFTHLEASILTMWNVDNSNQRKEIKVIMEHSVNVIPKIHMLGWNTKTSKTISAHDQYACYTCRI